jgi:hypothetical protein
MTEEEIRIQQRSRARVTGILLIGFAVLIFAISLVKIGVAAS